jgi:hypothetical protein
MDDSALYISPQVMQAEFFTELSSGVGKDVWNALFEDAATLSLLTFAQNDF